MWPGALLESAGEEPAWALGEAEGQGPTGHSAKFKGTLDVLLPTALGSRPGLQEERPEQRHAQSWRPGAARSDS